jgi:septal ring factor EnvC (AmiA/AmiB activator)
MRKKIIITVLTILGFLHFLQAQPVQDKTELEKERLQLQKDIEEIQKQYDKVKGQTKQNVAQLNILNRKIKLQESYIRNIDKELRMIDDDIYLSNIEIYRLQKQLDTLRSQYSRSVVYAYKNRSTYDYLNFIFSAGDFNDAIKRIAYLKGYRSYREQQVGNIIETRKLIDQRKQQQLVKKDQKRKALDNQTRQKKDLDEQKKEKDAVVARLKSQEKDLQKQLLAKKKRDIELKNAYTAIINREMAKAAEEVKKSAITNPVTNPSTSNIATIKTTKSGTSLDLRTTDIKLNSEFKLNQGKLPWPVDNGYVCIHFGSYTIEGTRIKGDNPGITICTPQSGVPIKSVFDGEVAGVFNSGDEMSVIIRHGKYFTVYSNLSSVNVKKGEEVKTGESVGKLGADDEGSGGRLDFLLMIEKKNVNPETWLTRH